MSIKVGFICTGNSARSQIAEGFAKYYSKKLNKDIVVYSAGSRPTGYIHPLAIKVMKEKDIDISNQKSKSLNDIPLNSLDYVITLCSDAEKSCPVIPNANVQHWRLPDPAKIEGTDEQKLEAFRNIRDKIERKILKFLDSIR